jgi:hypothetical protein
MNTQLTEALNGVARRVRRVRLWAGLASCWAVWALAGAAFLWSGMPVAPSYVIGLAFLAVLTGLSYTVLVLRSERDPLRTARRVEARYPDLDAGLLAAVEEERAAGTARLGFLQASVIGEAIVHNLRNDWITIVPSRRIGAAYVAHAVALGALLCVLGVLSVHARQDVARVALHGARAQARDVQVSPGDAEIERGTTLLVVAKFPATVPPEVTLVAVDSANAVTTRAMTRSLEDPTFAGRIESVSSDFSYRIEFEHEHSRDFHVRVFEYPELVRTDAKLVFPDFASAEPKTVEDIRHVTAVEGTGLTLICRLNKDVATANLIDEAGKEISLTPLTDGSLAYTTSFTLVESHRYKVQLVDHEGRKNKHNDQISINVTKNQPPIIAMNQPAHDVRVSPVEELQLKAQVRDDFGVVRHGLTYSRPGTEPKEIVFKESTSPSKRVTAEQLIDFEGMKAQPDELVTYYFWAEDLGADGKPRRTDGDMYFAEVRHFEEIFRQGEQPSGGEQGDQAASQNAQEAENLAEQQKQIINGTWRVIRRETRAQPTEQFKPDVKVLQESQQALIEQAKPMGARLRDASSRASLDQALKAMGEAARHLGDASARSSIAELKPAFATEQTAYQALLKLRAREFEVIRANQRQSRGGRASGARRQLNQLELENDENRFEQQNRARQQQNSEKDEQARETRQVMSRLRELAQRQADLNERLKELQSALEAAKDEPTKQELERQLKRLRDQQQQILRDTDELRERMENEQNRDRMAEARDQVDQARENVRQAGDAMDQGRVSRALNEGSRANRRLNDVRDDLRKQSSARFSEELTEMRNESRRLDERQERLTEQIEAPADRPQPTLKDGGERRQIQQGLAEQKKGVENLVERMRNTVNEAEENEPLLAKNLYDTVRKSDEQAIPDTLKEAEKLVEMGVPKEAAESSRRAAEGIDELRQGVERAAKNVLGDETEALRRAREEVDELANEIDREVAQGTGKPQPGERPDQRGAASPSERDRQSGEQRDPFDDLQFDRGRNSDRAGQRRDSSRESPDQPGSDRQRRGQADRERQQSAQRKQRANQGGEQGAQGEMPGGDGGVSANRRQNSLRDRNNPTENQGPQAGARDGNVAQGGADRSRNRAGLAAAGPARPITGEGFREWSDRMRDVEELLDDPGLRAEAARIRDRVRGEREEFKRHAKTPDWNKLQNLVAEPIRELERKIAQEVARRASPEALVPIDRDPVPPRFSEGVRRYYERLGSGR